MIVPLGIFFLGYLVGSSNKGTPPEEIISEGEASPVPNMPDAEAEGTSGSMGLTQRATEIKAQAVEANGVVADAWAGKAMHSSDVDVTSAAGSVLADRRHGNAPWRRG
jgi:hypothetical protein